MPLADITQLSDDDQNQIAPSGSGGPTQAEASGTKATTKAASKAKKSKEKVGATVSSAEVPPDPPVKAPASPSDGPQPKKVAASSKANAIMKKPSGASGALKRPAAAKAKSTADAAAKSEKKEKPVKKDKVYKEFYNRATPSFGLKRGGRQVMTATCHFQCFCCCAVNIRTSGGDSEESEDVWFQFSQNSFLYNRMFGLR